ncbi:MAG: ComEC/Rec2 family competence protein [Paraclostridium sp.]|uniref:ComEC/Rec2 family competence protein n=1 Tax=Paraclostridium sp. TaxID=2023273 RepID=UPI003F36ECDB
MFSFYLTRKEKRKILILVIIVLTIFAFILGYSFMAMIKSKINKISVNGEAAKNEVEVHILDTGNSDCILIKGKKNILIDGAEDNDEIHINTYLKKEGISKIDYVISTHYHRDHLGGLDSVIKNFEIGEVLISNGNPKDKYDNEFINSLSAKNIKAKIPKEGEVINLDSNSYLKIYNTQGGEYINDESLITLYCNGEDKFLFAADAEDKTEKRVLESMEEVDFLKIGHHGAWGSTSEVFLDVLKPKYAVITVGENNPYFNPHEVVMKRLKEREIEVHRTDECGNIKFTSTGSGIYTECKKGSYRHRVIKQLGQ